MMCLEEVALEAMHRRPEDEIKRESTNSINALWLPARDGYAFALQLLDVLFTKEELVSSLLLNQTNLRNQGWTRPESSK